MKVVYFCNLVSFKIGAMECLFVELSKHFSANVRPVFVLGGQPSQEVVEYWKQSKVDWAVLEGWTDQRGKEHPWKFCVSALGFLRKHNPDLAVVHFGNELQASLVALQSKMCGLSDLKWIWVQDQQVRKPTFFTKIFSRLRLVSLFFDKLVAVYEGGKLSMLQRGVKPDRIAVIHNGVQDYRRERAPGWLRKQVDARENDVIILSVGSLIPRKRLDFLITAAAQIKEKFRLVIIGDGVEGSRLEALSQQLEVSEKVCFLGHREDVRDLLVEVDIYAHTATAEACSYAVLEAMCAGKPIIMTDAGAAREQVEDGINGYVLGQDDVDGFVGKLKSLVENPRIREEMGTAARFRWEKLFRLEDTSQKYVELFREIHRE